MNLRIDCNLELRKRDRIRQRSEKNLGNLNRGNIKSCLISATSIAYLKKVNNVVYISANIE